MRPINPQLKDECERLLSLVLKRGDKLRLAEKLGVSLSEISQQANPEEIRTSDFYRFTEFIESLKDVNHEAAKLIVADLQSRVDRAECHECDMAKLTGQLAKEETEAVLAHIHKAPIHVQRKEWLDVRNAVDQGLAALSERKPNEIAVGRKPVARLRRAG